MKHLLKCDYSKCHFLCGDNMGCGTTTDESDDNSISEKKQVPPAKKLKVDAKNKRCM